MPDIFFKDNNSSGFIIGDIVCVIMLYNVNFI
jgi:hypothetical protein